MQEKARSGARGIGWRCIAFCDWKKKITWHNLTSCVYCVVVFDWLKFLRHIASMTFTCDLYDLYALYCCWTWQIHIQNKNKYNFSIYFSWDLSLTYVDKMHAIQYQWNFISIKHYKISHIFFFNTVYLHIKRTHMFTCLSYLDLRTAHHRRRSGGIAGGKWQTQENQHTSRSFEKDHAIFWADLANQ